MPKRLRDDVATAAHAAAAPPRSDDYPDDDDSWVRAQDDWLQRWQPGTALPARGDKKRRTEWDKLTKKHARHASKPGAEPDVAAPGLAPPLAEEMTLPANSRSWELRALREVRRPRISLLARLTRSTCVCMRRHRTRLGAELRQDGHVRAWFGRLGMCIAL